MLKSDNKKKGPPVKTIVKPPVTSARVTIWDVSSFLALGEVTSANLGIILGLEAFAINNPVVAKILLQGIVLPADKKTVGKLELDVVAVRFYHAFSQVSIFI